MGLDGTMLLYNYCYDGYMVVPFRVSFGKRFRAEVENSAGRYTDTGSELSRR